MSRGSFESRIRSGLSTQAALRVVRELVALRREELHQRVAVSPLRLRVAEAVEAQRQVLQPVRR
jgi:hypothetical protein